LLAVVLTSFVIGAGTSASGQTPTDTTYTIALETDGNATVTLTYIFNLETSAEANAFDQLETDTAVRTQLADEFQVQMSRVAERTAGLTNRSMAVRNATVSFNRTKTVGFVDVQIKWVNLTNVTDDGRLRLSEPFRSSFTPDGVFRVTAPSGHSIVSMSPEPAQETTTTATWDADATLSGFNIVTAPTDVDGDEADAPTTPMFTSTPTTGYTTLAAALVLVALSLITVMFVIRRR
jgi:hypothetical protein